MSIIANVNATSHQREHLEFYCVSTDDLLLGVSWNSHIDNVVGSDINQSDMGHDGDTVSGNTAFGDSDDIQQVFSIAPVICSLVQSYPEEHTYLVFQACEKCSTPMTKPYIHGFGRETGSCTPTT